MAKLRLHVQALQRQVDVFTSTNLQSQLETSARPSMKQMAGWDLFQQQSLTCWSIEMCHTL